MRAALLSALLVLAGCAGQCAAIGSGGIGAGSVGEGVIGGRKAAISQPAATPLVAVDIANSGAELTDHQVLIEDAVLGDSAAFYSAAFGGAVIPFWRESAGRYWVKAPTLTASGTTTIYARLDGSGTSDADTTFEFFDDFPGSTIDLSKWTPTTPAGTSLTVSGGAARLTSPSGTGSVSILGTAVAGPVITESRVQYHTDAVGARHRHNTSTQDWGAFRVTSLLRVFWNGAEANQVLLDVWYDVYEHITAGNVHMAEIPAVAWSDTKAGISSFGAFRAVVGAAGAFPGDMSLDWVRCRKHTSNTITVTVAP